MNISDNQNFVPLKSADPFSMADEFEFNIEQPRTDSFNSLDDEIIDLTEQVRIMDCRCPYCSERTEVDLLVMPEGGKIPCPFCSKVIHILKESCVCRARRKSHEINCANCGGQLGRHVHCQSCGMISPDYFVTFDPAEAHRRARREYVSQKWAALKSLNLSFTPAFGSGERHSTHGSPHQNALINASEPSHVLSRKMALVVTGLVAVTALVVGGVFMYNSHKSEQAYAATYFQALYCVKTGIDNNIKAGAVIKTEWESASASGRNFSPASVNSDPVTSNKLRSEIDKYVQKLDNPPERFSKANENLIKMHKIYLDTDRLLETKPASLQSLGANMDAINKKMTLTTQELKSDLSGPLKIELETAKLKYRGLKDF